MQFRSLTLIISTVAVIGALAVLFAVAGETPSPDVSEQALERARQRHQRSQAAGTRSTHALDIAERPTAARGSKPFRKRTSGQKQVDEKVEEFEPESRPRPMPRPEMPEADDSAGGGGLEERMRAVNQLYDRRDYETAIIEAKAVLEENPGNVRMLRVVVSSACMMGDENEARTHFDKLPPRHRRQMQRRCARYGMSFAETE